MERQPEEEKQYLLEVDASEEEEEEEEPKRPWGRIILIIILLILLLLLFWPVKKGKKAPPPAPAAKLKGIGIIGETHYQVISSKPHFEFGGTKWTIVGVTFKVRNLASKARVLDYSAVKLGDEFGNESAINDFYTENYYERIRKKSPWGRNIAPKGRKRVQALFLIYKGPPKRYYFAGKDLDFRSNEFLKLDAGVINVIPPQ